MVVHAYYPLGETRVQRQAQALVKQGYSVDILCLHQAGEPESSLEDGGRDRAGINVYRLPLQRHRGGGFVLQMLEYLTFFMLVFFKLITLHYKRQYSVVQVHNLPDFLIFAALYPRLTGARLILDLHDLMPEFFAARSERPMSSWLVRAVIWQEQISCRFAHHVITVTDVWKETLIQRGVPAGKVSVIMNVADPEIFTRKSRIAATERKMSERQASPSFHLIYHGTFTHRYGVDLLLCAVNELRIAIPEIHLTLLGGGEYQAELERLIAEFNLQNHVTLSQRMLHASELPALLMEADAGIVPNRSNIFTDGLLPTKLMEYVAMGIPVIASRTPTIVSYFDEQMVAFFEPGNAQDLAHQILVLYRDRPRLHALAQHADQFNSRYNWEVMAGVYTGLVTRLQPELKRSAAS